MQREAFSQLSIVAGDDRSKTHGELDEERIIRWVPGAECACNPSTPEFRDINRRNGQGFREAQYAIDVLRSEPFEPHRLPDDIAELGFPVRRSKELPAASKKTRGLFSCLRLTEQCGGDDVGIDDQFYGRPSSIAVWISSNVI